MKTQMPTGFECRVQGTIKYLLLIVNHAWTSQDPRGRVGQNEVFTY